MTFISRILGYVRDAVIAAIFGAGLSADAFFVAFRISNLFRRLLGEGALTSSFIPVYTDVLHERSPEEARRFVSSVFIIALIVLTLITIPCIIFSAEIVAFMAPGFVDAPDGKFALTVTLTQWMFPFMVFVGLMAVAMGVLHSFRHFTMPAIAPVLLNISIIASALLLRGYFPSAVYALAVGVLVGGLLQLLIQLPFLRRYGMFPTFCFNIKDPAIKRIFLLMGPAIVGVGVYQLNIFITLRFASHLAEGSIAYLYYGSRLMELPLGIFVVSLATVILPSLSSDVTKKDFVSFKRSLSHAMRLVNFVCIPATVGLIILAYPIVDVLFLRGAFGAGDARETAYVLYFFAAGIVPIALSRIFISVYYSLKDTKTPVVIAVVCVVVNLIGCMLLIGPLGHGGLALATTIAATANFIMLAMVLKARVSAVDFISVVSASAKSLLAAIIMGVVLYVALNLIGWPDSGIFLKAGLIAVFVCGGALLYFMLSILFKIKESAVIKAIVVEKFSSKRFRKEL
ncbi:MAG: murein biosynthesis integral membrane protein MurJ [Deltaproteobacteria bacterium]|nr:murein biosynthesis integral membrane protein MurJ [Deltaproteobacteria bacterium]